MKAAADSRLVGGDVVPPAADVHAVDGLSLPEPVAIPVVHAPPGIAGKTGYRRHQVSSARQMLSEARRVRGISSLFWGVVQAEYEQLHCLWSLPAEHEPVAAIYGLSPVEGATIR